MLKYQLPNICRYSTGIIHGTAVLMLRVSTYKNSSPAWILNRRLKSSMTKAEHTQCVLHSFSLLLTHLFCTPSVDISFPHLSGMARIIWRTSVICVVFFVILVTWFHANCVLGWHEATRLVCVDLIILLIDVSNLLLCLSVLHCRNFQQVAICLHQQVYLYHMVCTTTLLPFLYV